MTSTNLHIKGRKIHAQVDANRLERKNKTLVSKVINKNYTVTTKASKPSSNIKLNLNTTKNILENETTELPDYKTFKNLKNKVSTQVNLRTTKKTQIKTTTTTKVTTTTTAATTTLTTTTPLTTSTSITTSMKTTPKKIITTTTIPNIIDKKKTTLITTKSDMNKPSTIQIQNKPNDFSTSKQSTTTKKPVRVTKKSEAIETVKKVNLNNTEASKLYPNLINIITTKNYNTSNITILSDHHKVDEKLLLKSVVQKTFVDASTFSKSVDRTTRTPITSTSSQNTVSPLRHYADYRSFPWYFIVIFGFAVSVVIFSIVYFTLKRCKYLPYLSGIRNEPRESSQSIKEIDIRDDEAFDCVDYRNGNLLLKESSASLLKPKSFSNKRRSLLFSLKPNHYKASNGSILKSTISGKTNDSLASHCTTITTISAASTTSPSKKENPKKLSSKKKKELENDEDRELTVIDPLLNKQWTGKIYISTPPENKK